MEAPYLRISSEDDLTLFAGRGPRGGLVHFETTAFTDVELRHLRALDVLFVASAWAREIAIANGLPPDGVVVAPNGVDRALFIDADPPRGGRTVFLHAGAWQHRKGQDAIVEAFSAAFRPGDAVELQMLCDNPWSAIDQTRWYDLCRASPMADHITILSRLPTLRDVVTLMYDDPEMRAHGLVVEQQHPKVGRFLHFGQTITFSDTPQHIQGPPPVCGQHTREILRQHGYEDTEIDKLVEARAIFEDLWVD